MTSDGWREVGVDDLVARTPNALATGPFGSAISSRFFRAAGVPVIRGSNLSVDPEIRLKDEGLVFLESAKAAEFSRSVVVPGDLVFTSWGTINQVGLIDGSAAYERYVISNKQMKMTPDPNKASAEFLYYLFSAPATQQEILDGAVGTGVPGFNLTRLRSMRFRVPPLPEQRAIATAISEADALATKLRELIKKKREMLQGMMQALLTGQTRLPGSSGDWHGLRVAAASHLKARIGWQGLTTQEYRHSGDYRLVGGTDFRNGRVDWETTPYVDKWRFDQDPNICVKVGDVLLTKDGTIGKTAFVNWLPGPATLNSGVFVLRPKRGAYDPEFLYWMLRSRMFERFVAGLSAGSTINHLYQRDLVTLELDVPPTTEEQSAIAAGLSQLDQEISTLEQRLTSARAIKTGMMQELLTGRTRLLVEAAS
ncbi:restriction endonuclease subunit S [Nocardioides sp. J2M5]|uniref:restriction endonuclease subunit S n=1 Tax=Nocardioides palaemonis TaxID=2829810 RepID=UPI001BA83B1A|nr:restriction endonuclease subunit S [Nocardioides palaemonis]MBS2940189.1 restriction endonuclease subunit S [Nocardioides palaemonis]